MRKWRVEHKHRNEKKCKEVEKEMQNAENERKKKKGDDEG